MIRQLSLRVEKQPFRHNP